jgi:Kef-type K+ transport system membrane component KefB
VWVPLLLLGVQVALIAGVAHLAALALRRIHQPPVIGQMLAGILLGASALGLLAAPWQAALFPAGSLSMLKLLGQVGVVIYMFVVGMRLDHGFFDTHGRGAAAVSAAGVLVPLGAGVIFASLLVGDPKYFSAGRGPLPDILFLAAAMAVTAFPVMARIIDERGLTGTLVADIALVAGSFSDLIAWSLLAIVMSVLAATITGALVTFGGAVVFVAVVLGPVRLALRRLATSGLIRRGPPGWPVVLVGLLLVAAAIVTEQIGVHPAFGAFVLGAAVPKTGLVGAWPERVSRVSVPVLLPVYFAYSGLNTRLGLIGDGGVVLLTLAIIAVASLSKGVATTGAARLAGFTPRDSIAIGALMNARGLVELILLNTGLERGVITPTLFSAMVAMAVVTTLATSPVLSLVYRRRSLPPRHETDDAGDRVEVFRDKVLVPDGDAKPLLDK